MFEACHLARQGQTACIKTHLNQSSQPWGPAVHATPRPQRVHIRPDCRQGWQCTNRTQSNRLRYTLIYLSLIPTRLILWRQRFLPTRWPIRSIVATSSLMFAVRTKGSPQTQWDSPNTAARSSQRRCSTAITALSTTPPRTWRTMETTNMEWIFAIVYATPQMLCFPSDKFNLLFIYTMIRWIKWLDLMYKLYIVY